MEKSVQVLIGVLALVAVVLVIYLFYYMKSSSGFTPAAGGHNGYTVKVRKAGAGKDIAGNRIMTDHTGKSLWFYTFGDEPKWYLFEVDPLGVPQAVREQMTPLASGTFSGPLGKEIYRVSTGRKTVVPGNFGNLPVLGRSYTRTDPDGYKHKSIAWFVGDAPTPFELF